MTRLAAIVLAAGRSSRMVELKPLLPLGGVTVLERAVGSLLEAGIADVRVVVGWRGAEVGAAVADLSVAVVVNDRWRSGMFSSVAAGVASLGSEVEAFFLLPADCALVRAETLGRLARVAGARPAPAPVVYPVRGGRRGHPPLITRGALPADLGHEPADGLRGCLAAHDAAALEIEVDDEGVLLDMDAPPDYERARDYVAGEGIPDAAVCLTVLDDAHVPRRVVDHSRAVAGVAMALTGRLNEHGQHLNAHLVEAAALLHDIARTGRDHARAGAALLCDLGYRRVAAVAVHHMDLQDEDEAEAESMPPEASDRSAEAGLGQGDVDVPPGEAEVLYLADKLVAGTQVVDLRDRLAARLDDLRAEPDAQTHARARLERAAGVARAVERLIGEPAEAVARRALAATGDGGSTTRL